MAEKADDYVYITKWHKDYQPDPHSQVGDIYSGLRAPAGSRAKDVTSPCQYWVKGMPGICISFSNDKCNAQKDEDGKYPTGYNNGHCDYLGRRNWCSHYESAFEDLNEYICIAPDIFRTGLGKRDDNVTTHLELIPYPKSEILGYNPDAETGKGKCDGLGMGRGEAGEDTTDPEKMYELPVVCRHYKPWMMGFGAIKPRPMGTAILEGKDIYDGSKSDPLSTLTRYLPFLFRLYNMRASYQKCAYWDQDFGTDFEMDYLGGFASISLPEDSSTECTCTNGACTPYKTIVDEWLPNTSDTLQYVLTKEKGVVCNGAKPECPCYTGKWYFCIDDNMRDGMRITAEQILELRFWYAVWQTKKLYDAMFAEKSGPSGSTTSDLFTFDKWEKLGTEVADSVMKGKRIYQCFPIPLNQRVFDPKVYLTKKKITYPKMNVDTGTLSSTESPFPTLVRAVDEGVFVPPLDVIYPYFCKDPWGVTPCDKKSAKSDNMELASCKIKSPVIAIFGYTVRNKKVYALNTNEIDGASIFHELKNTFVSLLPEKEKESINESIRNLISSSMESGKTYKYTTKGTSDNYGYFGIGPLQLEYNTITSIAIICEWQPGEYEVVIRDVDTKFYGACIVQDSFKYEPTNIVSPSFFSTVAELSGYVNCFGGECSSVFPIYNKYVYGVMQDTVYYSYCINEYTEEDVSVSKWVRIGPTGYIWAEIDNVNLSYLFDFEVTKAYIIPKNDPNKPLDNLNVCGDTSGSKIELKIIFPKPDDPDAIKREHLLPNCVLLKSPEPQGFFNEDWSLFIEYKYRKLETQKAASDSDTESTVWPSDLDGENSPNKFVDPPFSLIAADGGGFKVENIRSGTIAVMAYVMDDDDRVQSAVATKMLCDIVTTRCRPVEISYSYTADAVGYDLIPNSGFFTWVGRDKGLGGDYKHYNQPKCGDHDCRPDNCIGPMWYPFNDCTSVDFYSWYSGAVSCTAKIEGQPRSDWRYSMAHAYRAWVRGGSNWAASCGNGWYYSYSRAGESMFSGYGKIRTSVISLLYDEMGWTMPPFGNDGREITERWLSQEHYGFWDLSGVKQVPKSEYMPLVFDDEMLFTSFNAFDEKGRIGPIDDCLHTTCMLNCMLSNVISEELTENRYRFEDLFRVINHAWCMYPPPVYEGPGDSVTARRYSFKIEDVAWAWREYWKDIERQACSTYGEYALNSTLFNFVDFNRPEYYFDSEKTEHRLITDEGNVNIVFIAPVMDEEGEGGYEYPEISIEAGAPRKFEIIYDLYDSEQVEWMDEGGDGTEGGSGGEEGSSIYEEAMGDDWFHDDNTIFDSNASAEKSDDRKIVLSKDALLGDTYAWYNRGLIANIVKDRLTYLPYSEKYRGPAFTDTETSDKGTRWTNDSLFSKNIIFSYIGGGCVSRITIRGKLGSVTKGDWFTDAGIYCKPEITVAECGVDDELPCSSDSGGFPPSILYKVEGEKGNDYSGLESYSITIELARLPKRMLHNSSLLQIKCTLFAGQSLMFERNPLIFTSVYIDATETIKVWEQRYITSTGDFGDKNPDGEDSSDLRSFDRDLKNAGQYFPTGVNSTNSDSIQCMDKMTIVGAGEQHYEDIDLSISKSNLKAIESEEQQKLYNDAYSKDGYDELTYSIILPPNIQQFLATFSMEGTSLGGTCNFTSKKLEFTKHWTTESFNQEYDFWSPGGHYFKWGDSYYQTNCYFAGPIETVYSPVVVHHKHGGEEAPISPYEAYVGWGKLIYYEGKLAQAIIMGKGPGPSHYTSAGLNVQEVFN